MKFVYSRTESTKRMVNQPFDYDVYMAELHEENRKHEMNVTKRKAEEAAADAVHAKRVSRENREKRRQDSADQIAAMNGPYSTPNYGKGGGNCLRVSHVCKLQADYL